LKWFAALTRTKAQSMRSPSALFVLLAALTAFLATGCETHDRVLYKYEPAPLRIKEPNFKRPPEPAPVEEQPGEMSAQTISTL
jgi:hypothetical protein